MKQSTTLIFLFLLSTALNPSADFKSPAIEGFSKLFGLLPKFKFLEVDL